MSVFILKILALFFMLVDHIGMFFVDAEIYPTQCVLLRTVGRLSAPIFWFLLVEGIVNTSNKKKYLARLSIFAGIMAIGDIILNLIFKPEEVFDSNMFLTFVLVTIFIFILEEFKKLDKKKKIFAIIAEIAIVILMNFVNYSYVAFFTILIFYIYRKNIFKLSENKNKYLAIGLMVLILPITVLLTSSPLQVVMFLIFPVLFSYNGKLGISKTSKFYNIQKYFFYVFYIVHLWIFFIISQFL